MGVQERMRQAGHPLVEGRDELDGYLVGEEEMGNFTCGGELWTHDKRAGETFPLRAQVV
jgi:hypothetical protein